MVELREHAHDVTNHLLTGFAVPDVGPVIDAVADADGLIAVTPIFNASYSGLFKSFFDVLARRLAGGQTGADRRDRRHRPALAGAGARGAAAVRLPAGVVVPTAVFAAPEDWATSDGGDADEEAVADEAPRFAEPSLRTRIDRASRELAELVEHYKPVAPADPFALTTSFEDLLGTC